MNKKDLNVIKNCRELGVSLWQCPQFLFLIMGIAIIASSFIIYFVGARYIQDFYLIALMAIVANFVLLLITFIITRSFEKVVQASRMKSELTGIVIHQIRSPLTNLKWALEGIDLGDSKKDLDRSLKRMTELTDDLLIISKIEEKGFTLNKTRFFLDELVEEVIKGFSSVSLEIKTDLEKTEIMADYSQIRLVIENLLDNAIRYSPGGKEINIKLFNRNKSAIFKIKDQGVGIPEKDKKNIFEKFFRSNNELKNKVKGSGLGLYIVKTIIDKHKGKIWFSSRENKGTTFYFSIQK